MLHVQVTRETTDEFVGRQQGYVMLYAAVTQVGQLAAGGACDGGEGWVAVTCPVCCSPPLHPCPLPSLRAEVAIESHHGLPLPWLQSDNPRNPHGLANAWVLLARLLNALPANRVTATAVDAMLKVCWGVSRLLACICKQLGDITPFTVLAWAGAHTPSAPVPLHFLPCSTCSCLPF